MRSEVAVWACNCSLRESDRTGGCVYELTGCLR